VTLVSPLSVRWVVDAGQVLGVITSDFFSTPFSYTINLPFAASGLQVDLDQNDGKDTGV